MAPPPPPPPAPSAPKPSPLQSMNHVALMQVIKRNSLSQLSNTSWINDIKEQILQVYCKNSPRYAWKVLLPMSQFVPRMQIGPTCGLTGIIMAIETVLRGQAVTPDLGDDLIRLLTEARMAGISRQGEMFSAYWLTELAHRCYRELPPSDLSSWQELEFGTEALTLQSIANCLEMGGIPLICYDAGRDHSPVQEQGFRAHWALILGIICVEADSADASSDDDKITYRDSLDAESLSSSHEIYIVAQHGKSRRAGIWTWDSLYSSNKQLFQNLSDPLEMRHRIQQSHRPEKYEGCTEFMSAEALSDEPLLIPQDVDKLLAGLIVTVKRKLAQ
eukprot:TRINITY_DN1450_c0_g1::TRINITY_DN1450_c0_g1_i1::g.27230::m.27230 TRINITY_DN1450_c0_g1::TRINITY_DN1450_c0_g1_i1::g.27230  ORF type:complete len:331 (+),score=-15.67,sp/B0BM95/CS054_XENTR/30.95/6e-17 TRINITY_DN1450_c0_g1_i1:112-1104(+)